MKRMYYILPAICIGLVCLIILVYVMQAEPQVDALSQAMSEVRTAVAEYDDAMARGKALSTEFDEAMRAEAKAIIAAQNGEITTAEATAVRAETDRVEREIKETLVEIKAAGVRANVALARVEALTEGQGNDEPEP